MQDPNEDTEWNDILRAKGIIPEKAKDKGITEDEIVNMVDAAVKERFDDGGQKELGEMTLDELDELEDQEEEAVLAKYREQRMAEIRALQARAVFGDVREISAEDYVRQVNQAGDGVYVVLHLYKQGVPLCSVLNHHLAILASKFRTVKFLKSISTTCVPNYPDKNLPTIFVYYEGQLKHQMVGPDSFRGGHNMTPDDLEYALGKFGAVDTKIKKDPRPTVTDYMMASLGVKDDDGDNNDW